MSPHSVVVVRHVPHEDLGILAELFHEAQLTLDLRDAFAGDLGNWNSAAAGLVVLGGPMNVYETARYPFLATEVEWLRQALESGLPVLGVCLGAQLLAVAAGARVYPNGEKEIGWRQVQWREEIRQDGLFHDFPAETTVFQWHGDTFNLPPGSAHLASSAACSHQAFRVGPCAWGLQFHLEITPRLLETWLAEPGMCAELCTPPLAGNLAEKMKSSAPSEFPKLAHWGRKAFKRFAQLCRERAQAGPAA